MAGGLAVAGGLPQAGLLGGPAAAVGQYGQDVAVQPAGQVTGAAGVLGGAQGRAEPGGAARANGEPAQVGKLSQLIADLVGAVGSDPLGGGEPDRGARLLRYAKERGLDLEGGEPPRFVCLVQCGGVLVQPPLPVHEAAVQAGVLWRGGPLRQVERFAEVAGDARPVPRPFVDVENRFAQVNPFQPGQHGVDRGPFLGHEQHLPAPRDQGGNQVRDGLALAGARRAVDHQAVPGQHGADGAALRGVGIQDGVVLLGRVEDGLAGVVAGQQFLGGDVTGDGGHHVAVVQQLRRRLQVPDHGQLGIGERADDLAADDLEAGHLSGERGVTQLLVQPFAGLVREPLGVRAEHAGQLVQKHRVDLGVVVEGEVEVVVPGPGRGDGEPAQQYRRGRFEEQLIPARQPGGQVGGPDAALLQQLAGLAVDGLHPADRIGPDVHVVEQFGEPDRPGPAELLQRLGIGGRQVERPGPAILVIQQRVPPAQIGERGDPPLPRRLDQLGPAVVGRVGAILRRHVGLFGLLSHP